MQTHRNIFKQSDSAKTLCEKRGVASARAAPGWGKSSSGMRGSCRNLRKIKRMVLSRYQRKCVWKGELIHTREERNSVSNDLVLSGGPPPRARQWTALGGGTKPEPGACGQGLPGGLRGTPMALPRDTLGPRAPHQRCVYSARGKRDVPVSSQPAAAGCWWGTARRQADGQTDSARRCRTSHPTSAPHQPSLTPRTHQPWLCDCAEKNSKV